MASIAEGMGDKWRLVGAHEVERYKRENGLPKDAKTGEVNAHRRARGWKPYVIMPTRLRMKP